MTTSFRCHYPQCEAEFVGHFLSCIFKICMLDILYILFPLNFLPFENQLKLGNIIDFLYIHLVHINTITYGFFSCLSMTEESQKLGISKFCKIFVDDFFKKADGNAIFLFLLKHALKNKNICLKKKKLLYNNCFNRISQISVLSSTWKRSGHPEIFYREIFFKNSRMGKSISG